MHYTKHGFAYIGNRNCTLLELKCYGSSEILVSENKP